MVDDKKKDGEACEKAKEVSENLHDIECECYENEEQGKVCTCSAVKETEVKDGEECADPWTGYERGEKGKKEGEKEE